MRRIWVFILFLAISCQLSAVSGQQNFSETENLRTSKSESILTKDKRLRSKGNVQKFSDSQVFSFSDSKKSSQFFRFSDSQIQKNNSQVFSFSDSQIQKNNSQFFSFSVSQIQYYENQIRLADSLYKNYLPQSNFEEVKAAMEFFDSVQLSAISRQRWRLFDKKVTDENMLIAESRLLTAAKAHYYHAVGLTERDDIVGACEHYLRALEIMEPLVETSPLWRLMTKDKGLMANGERLKSQVKENAHSSKLEAQSPDYEKIRFLALTYTRLGRLFTNENYCDLAMSKYKKALNCLNIIKDSIPISYTYKTIGNVYQLLDKADSALYHYRRSLEIYSGLTNKLDIEKSIAQILFEKGEKDSAYIMITNNINKIDNINVRYSYYNTLGEMYVEDKEYDSAAYYLAKSVNSSITSIKVTASIKLSAIYDSIGDYEKKAYYDEIISKISINDVNKSLKNNKIQDVYDRYKERKIEKEKIKSRTRTKVIAISLSLLIIISFVIIILIWHKSKRKDRLHQESLNEKDRYIANKEEIISRTNEEIKRKESEIKKLVEIIESLKSDINSLKDDAVIKEEEISDKKTDIKKMENDLSAKEMELKRLQENVHENRILIDRLNEDNIAKEKQIECYLEEIDDNRQVINDKNHLISIATEGLVARKDAISENINEIARLQAIIDENDKIIKKLSDDHKSKEELIAVYLDKIEKLKTEIDETRHNLNDIKFRSSLIEGKIKSKNTELQKKEEEINRYKLELSEYKNKLEIISSDNNDNAYTPKIGMDLYLQSKVCSKILNEINELSARNRDANILTPLKQEELVMLLNSASFYVNNFTNGIACKYSKLKKEDLYYLCLALIGLKDKQISSLLGVTYNSIRIRKKNLCSILGIKNDELQSFLMNICN